MIVSESRARCRRSSSTVVELQKRPWLPPGQAPGVLGEEAHDLGASRSWRSRSSRRAGAATAARRAARRPSRPASTSGSESQNENPVRGPGSPSCSAPIAMNAGLAEVDDPGEADVELQPERDERVDAGDDADADPEAGSVSASKVTAAEGGRRRAYRLRLSEDALRPDDQHEDQDDEADGGLPARVDDQGRPLGHQPEHHARGQRPEGVADAAQDHGGEDRQQELEPELGLQVGGRPPASTPASPASAAGEDPGVEDHPRGVDARRSRRGRGRPTARASACRAGSAAASGRSPRSPRSRRSITISCVRPIRRPRNWTVLVLLTSSAADVGAPERTGSTRGSGTRARSTSGSAAGSRRASRASAPRCTFSRRSPSSAVGDHRPEDRRSTSGRPQVTFTRYAM